MKIISLDGARVAEFIVTEEVRPNNGLYIPTLHHALVQKYKFLHRPLDPSKIISEGAKFAHGVMHTGEKEVIIQELLVFNDGIIATANTTDSAEIILNDVLAWTKETFGLRDQITKKPRGYTSIIIVDFETALEKSLGAISRFLPILSLEFGHARDSHIPIDVFRLGFSADPAAYPNNHFLIERRAGMPHVSNRYFCSAALRTEAHIRLLEQFEKLAKDA